MRNVAFFSIMAMLMATSASAATIYGVNGLARPLDGPDSLIMFDSSNPEGWTTIGSMNVNNIGFGGLDFDAEGNLWAYAAFYKSTGGAASGLYRVDPSTGNATLQGTPSNQSLQDLAYNPVDGQMYGVNTQGVITKLYRVDLTTGGTSLVGTFTGMPSDQHAMSFAIDSEGYYYVHDLTSEKIFKGNTLALTELYSLPENTNYSQGMTIDWAHDDMGYHNAVGQGEYPHYYSRLNTFTTDGSAYVLGPEFGPELPDGLPQVECGDLAINPIPEPASLLLLTFAAAVLRRR